VPPDTPSTPVARRGSAQEAADGARERLLADLEEAQRLARLGSWSLDPRTDEANWSRQLYEIFGRDPSLGPATGDALLAYLHPDDRERAAAGYADAFAGMRPFELDYRIIAGDGVERTVHAVGREDAARPSCYVGSVQDVTDQQRGQRELLDATARAEGANRAKSELLARMSHELRTPLNTIIGFGQLLELEALGPRERNHVSFVLKEARHLLELINTVLDVSQIQSGQITVSSEPVALADTIRYVLALVAPLAHEHDVSLNFETGGLAHEGRVQADRNRLNQVMLNLLSNAIRYNRAGGRVDVSFAVTDDGRARTSIADTGTGIAADQLARVFEPFERLGAELTGIEGTGLGLTLAKGLVEAMGGKIEVSSRPGAGSTFVVELGSAQPRAADPQVGEQASPPQLGSPEGLRSRIIYIEDNLSNLTLVARIMDRYPGVELIPAMQAAIGLELARQHHPDLIVLDLHLPDMPGTEVLQRLKAEHPEVPVVVLTADARREQEARVRQLGAADYLTKPLDVAQFVNVLAANLKADDGGKR
jgi:signal transduction histidine kinase/ActR/RegA family two-component response regulator